MKIVLASSLVLGLLAACSQSEFKGSAPTTKAAAKTDDASPEMPEDSTPVVTTPVAESPKVIAGAAEESPDEPGLFVGCKVGSTSLPIVADVYKLPEGTSRLPDFATFGAKSDTVCLPNYNIPNQSWEAGFPGSNSLVEWFALNTRAKITAPVAGQYVFKITSDDGSNVYIDSNKIIDNDGQHASKTVEGTVTLTKGAHKLVLDWYQGPRLHLGVELFWKVPGSDSFVIVPTTAFSPE